jgi:hypothetical protein
MNETAQRASILKTIDKHFKLKSPFKANTHTHTMVAAASKKWLDEIYVCTLQ